MHHDAGEKEPENYDKTMTKKTGEFPMIFSSRAKMRKEGTMAKSIRIILLWGAILVLVVGGCSSTNTFEYEPESTPEPSPTSSTEPALEEELIVTGIILPERKKRSRKPKREQRAVPERQIQIPKMKKSEVVRRDAPISVYETLPSEAWFWSPQRRYQVFRDYGVNPTILTEAKPDSTFAMDVDDGSYKLALQMLRNQQLPHPEGIRVEEFVNALEYRYLPGENIFSLSAEAMPSPFRDGYHILHLGVQTKLITDEERLPANIVLVADISGSMSSDDKLELLKQAFMTLVSQLGKDDRVALVSYDDRARLVLAPTTATKKRKIAEAIRGLRIGGSTNAAGGIRLAYLTADKMFESGFINRVIFSSDGMANVGVTSPEGILQQVKSYQKKGIFLTTVGVGQGLYNDALLEQLADQGDGHYLYVGNQRDIRAAFVDKLNMQLQTVAKNAKAQVIFNEDAVTHYRLLGYENRSLAKEDFLDSSKDGGEVGAGHRVTAIYEVKLASAVVGEPLAKFSVAYQKPAGAKVFTMSKEVPSSIVKNGIADASSDLKLSASAAAFAEKLRLSYWSDLYDYRDILSLLSTLPSSYIKSQQVDELRQAIRSASLLDDRSSPYREQVSASDFNLDRVPLLK